MTRITGRLDGIRQAQLAAAGQHKPDALWTAERQAIADLERAPGPVTQAERVRLIDAARSLMARLAAAGPIPVA